jgi:hypothetical protein
MKTFRKLSQEVSNVLYEAEARMTRIQSSVAYRVPYVCQFAHPEHAELSLKNKLEPKDDTCWAETGASSPERYAEWAFTMCGMASVSMAIEYFSGQAKKPVSLAEDALKDDVYHTESDGTISSMKYREFKTWVLKYNIDAKIVSKLSVRGIQYALSNGKLVIVSVNPNIRQYETAFVGRKGGHLVLVTGYDREFGTISINNPSGFVSSNTQISHTMRIDEFKKYYAGRGIVLSYLR